MGLVVMIFDVHTDYQLGAGTYRYQVTLKYSFMNKIKAAKAVNVISKSLIYCYPRSQVQFFAFISG